MSKEIWKAVKGYEGRYEVSNQGRVRSIDRVYIDRLGRPTSIKGQIIKGRPINSGYLIVDLRDGFTATRFLVHRLVAMMFIPNDDPVKKTQVNHKNCIKTDNTVENLEWVSTSENRIHAFKHGIGDLGEKHFLAKLTNQQVIDIRHKCLNNPEITYAEIAKEYNVPKAIIANAATGRTYWNVSGPIIPFLNPHAPGEDGPNAKLTNDEVRYIRRRYKELSSRSQLAQLQFVKEVAAKNNVSIGTIRNALNYKTYKEI